jgi:transcription elongation GreA/GreB family factor
LVHGRQELRKYIERGDFQALEEAWLTRLTEDPTDLDFFVGAARALKGAGEAPRAGSLLAWLDDELARAGNDVTRLGLARAAGELLRPAAELHGSILGILRRLHGACPSLEGLLDHVGLHRAIEDLPRTWEKVDRLEALLAYELGAVVRMKDRGVGRVVEVNLELTSFRIEFEGRGTVRVGFAAAPKLLDALPRGHVLRRRLEAPEELVELKRRSPEELLLAVLADHPEGLSASEIRDLLDGVVSAGEWSAWWDAARGTPRVLAVGRGTRLRYRTASAGAEGEAAAERAFQEADPEGKLEIYCRQAGRHAERDAARALELERLASEAGSASTEFAFAVAWALADAGQQPPRGPWTPAERLQHSEDPAALAAGLGDRALRERAYRWIREHRDDAAAVLARAARLEDDTRLWGLLAGWLEELAPTSLLELADEALRQPRRLAAGFIWLAERAIQRPELRHRNPLRLLQHLFAALRHEEFKPHRARLRKLCEGGPLVPMLLDALDPGQLEAAAQAVDRAPLEEYVRSPLLERLRLRQPALRTASGGALYALPSSIEARREELRRLEAEEIPSNRRAIEEARELGDLRENFEYKAARQRHEYLVARAGAVERELAAARPIDLLRSDCTEVRIASVVRLVEDGAERTVAILGPWESDPARGVVSYDSDLGRALLGKRPGEEVELAGRRLLVLAIEPYRQESLN